ncbi:MAG: nuclear transport factor 2 family protein [Candidatus Binataceae bacterium]|nr:nuclear transport factor 2 family protein [Candidatus Binataceae bacterium]
MAKSMEQTVTELADRESIRDLPQRYCDCVWRGDVEGIVDLFVEDGTFSILQANSETNTTGRANLLKSYREGLAALTPRPYIHNHVIELKGAGRAEGRCYVELRSASNDFAWIGTGFYHDEYVKAGDQWKFQSRRFKALRLDAKPSK